MAVTNESQEKRMCSFVWRQTINFPTSYVWNIIYKLIITNVEAVHNFEVMFDIF
jgi:hypothetical protein